MGIAEWWGALAPETRDWLIAHNGEPLSAQVLDEVVAANNGAKDPSWWAGESTEGASQLTDDAVDWIESVANAEE
ncbi:MAG: hypothetical protein ACXWZL_03610 [Mycobacterium sp.]